MVTISAGGASQDVELRMNSGLGLIQYSTDAQATWIDISGVDLPVTIINSDAGTSNVLDVIITNPLTISSTYGSVNGYFIVGSSYIKFSGNPIIIDGVSSYPGFIRNGTSITNGFANIEINNVPVNPTNSASLAEYGGWTCQSYFGKGLDLSGCLVQNISANDPGYVIDASYAGMIAGAYFNGSMNSIYNNMPFNGSYAGGAVGAYSNVYMEGVNNYVGVAGAGAGGCVGAYSTGTSKFGGCYNGAITGEGAGGVFGTDCSGITIIQCGFNGVVNLSGTNAGGLVGSYCSGTITNCNAVNANISGQGAGGIAGAYFNGTIQNSFSGDTNDSLVLNGQNAGAIAGAYAGYNGSANFINCRVGCDISSNGIGAGGIVGAYAGQGGLVQITNCAMNGRIYGNYAGGIAGRQFGYNASGTCVISESYCNGNVSGSNAGGIVGADVGANTSTTPVVNISNCYSLGTIATSCGGIVGGTDGVATYTNTPAITITNNYSKGTYVNVGSGIVSTAYPKTTTQTSCYAANGTWSDVSASAALTGTPTGVGINNQGLVWTTLNTANTPYLLSSYWTIYQFYTPSSTSSSNNYVTNTPPNPPSNLKYYLNTSVKVGTTTTFYVYTQIEYQSVTNPFAYYGSTFAFTNTNVPGTNNVFVNISIGGLLSIYPNPIESSNDVYLKMDTTAIQYSVDNQSTWTTFSAGSWPVPIINANPTPSTIIRVIAAENLTISTSTDGASGTNGYFITGSQYITYDGSGNSVTIDGVTGYEGFISNGTQSGIIGYSNIVVQNFTTLATNGSTLAGGWLCRPSFARGASANFITNCTNSGAIEGYGNGGIAGGYAGTASGSVTFTNCTNSGNLGPSAPECGGIAGNGAGIDSGSATFTNCSNTGALNSSNTSGIAGNSAGLNSGSATFTNCTNTGALGSYGSCGIAGGYAGGNSGSATFTNCSNTGAMSSGNCAGIAGSYAGGTSGSATFTNCSNTGAMSSGNCAGIAGGFAGDALGSATLIKCFNVGDITGTNCGGIVGEYCCNNGTSCTITNCYNTGSISGSNSGGITGTNLGTNSTSTPVVNITNCYSLGTIATLCGGIIGGNVGGAYTNPPSITITNTYSSGTYVDVGSGIVASSYTPITTQTNCYAANGSWTDANNLTGPPSGVGLSNKGASWASYPSANTPYLLSSFLSYPIYDPSSAITSSQFYNVLPDITLGGSYTLASIEVLGQVATTQVLNILSTTPYYGYYSGAFTLTNTRAFEDVSVLINSSTGNISYAYNFTDPCFLEGTKILCFKNNQEIYRPIENLRKGDLVKTIYNGYMPINMICTSVLYNPGNDHRITNRLYKCSKERYPELFEDLYITGCHSILLPWLTDEQWELTKAVNGDVFVTDNHFRLIAYADELAEPFNKEGYMNIYHVALDHHDEYMNYGIYANGLLVESCSIDCLIYSGMKELGENDSIVAKNMSVNNADNISQMVGAC